MQAFSRRHAGASRCSKWRAKARRLKSEQKGLDLLIVDYLQLMSGRGRTESRQQEVSQISRELKLLAKELDIPLIALSQLSRAPENRTEKQPQLADLRDSGSIEQDADVVMFIYRDEVYDPETTRVNTPISISQNSAMVLQARLSWSF